MNEQPKSKVLIMIIGILLVANIALLALFLWGTNGKKDVEKRKDRSNYVSEYLEKEVGFNTAQLARYDSLSKKHREEMKAFFTDLSSKRKKTFDALAASSFSDSAIANAASEMHDRQNGLELGMLKHLREIRNICNQDQLTRFDTGFYKIFGRRGETHKEK